MSQPSIIGVGVDLAQQEDVTVYWPMKHPDREPDPDYWHVVDPDGESIFSAQWRELCNDHINDAIEFGSDEAATWVIRPLWSKPIG